LYQSFKEVKGRLEFAANLTTSEIDDIQIFLSSAMKNQCEGLMVKSLDKNSSYTPFKRSYSWLKVKKDYMEGVTDSLDLVPIGGYYGKGKRLGCYGAFLLACYDEENEEYQTICKIGTGFSDEMLVQHSNFLQPHVIEAPKFYYRYGGKSGSEESENNTSSNLSNNSLKPDVWFEPCQVWEVKTADLSISPNYMAAQGLVDPAKGVSLRFPRFIRIREDKSPEDATTTAQVAQMYQQQNSVE